MQPIFRVVVNHLEERRVATAAEADALCNELAVMPVFTANAYSGQGTDPRLDMIVETGRASVFYLDLKHQVKMVSRDEKCTERGIVSLRNDHYPDLELDQIELPLRSIISPERAIAIFRHYLKGGWPIDLVPWPAPDEVEWYGDLMPDPSPPLGGKGSDQDIPF